MPGSAVEINAMCGVRVDNGNVIAADIETGNGVIHVIDTVILPNRVPEERAKARSSCKDGPARPPHGVWPGRRRLPQEPPSCCLPSVSSLRCAISKTGMPEAAVLRFAAMGLPGAR